MKLAKSLLLGSAAALATVAGAQAADLPVRKAAPVAVEYVRVCSTYGAGFFVIPGTDSCVKIGGRVRMDAVIQERFSRGQDFFGYRSRGRLSFDVRTPTPYGLLRTFVRAQLTADSGSTVNGGAFPRTGDPTQKIILDQAFVQFGGLTAGRAPSFFSNTDLPTGHMGTLRFDDVPEVALFAYTFSFGNGFSASIAAEDPWARRLTGSGFAEIPGVGFGLTGGTFAAINPEGFRMPDVVGNLKFAGTWGSAQISGALHEVTDRGVAGVRSREQELGFAVAGYLSVNLPMIAAGDAAWLAATYSQGALQYHTGGGSGLTGNLAGPTSGATLGFDGNTPFFNVRGVAGNIPISDATIGPNGDLELAESLSVAGGVRHFWVPTTLRSNLFGSWWHVEYGRGASAVRPGGAVGPVDTPFAGIAIGGTRFGFVDFDEYRIGGNLIWSPISGLDIGVEVIYKNVQFDGRVLATEGGFGAEPLRVRRTDEFDQFEGRVRVQRDF